MKVEMRYTDLLEIMIKEEDAEEDKKSNYQRMKL
jgi:hypothetical protein